VELRSGSSQARLEPPYTPQRTTSACQAYRSPTRSSRSMLGWRGCGGSPGAVPSAGLASSNGDAQLVRASAPRVALGLGRAHRGRMVHAAGPVGIVLRGARRRGPMHHELHATHGLRTRIFDPRSITPRRLRQSASGIAWAAGILPIRHPRPFPIPSAVRAKARWRPTGSSPRWEPNFA